MTESPFPGVIRDGDLLSEEVYMLQKVSPYEDGKMIIRPISKSFMCSEQEGKLGIELVFTDEQAEQKGKGKPENPVRLPPLILRDPSDSVAWYHIVNTDKVSYMTKMRLNKPMWKYQAFFPCTALAAAIVYDWIAVALSNESISFVDPNEGCSCYPDVVILGNAKYFASVEDKLICFTTENVLYVWRVIDQRTIECLINVEWIGDLPPVKNIVLSNELCDGSLSPIIFTEEFNVRYSMSQDGWVFYGAEIPSIFEPHAKYVVTADCERAFHEALISHDSEVVVETFEILIECFLRQNPPHRMREFLGELFIAMKHGAKMIGGVECAELLKIGMEKISQFSEELATEIRESNAYQEAVNPPVIAPEPLKKATPRKVKRVVSQPAGLPNSGEAQDAPALQQTSSIPIPMLTPTAAPAQPAATTQVMGINQYIMYWRSLCYNEFTKKYPLLTHEQKLMAVNHMEIQMRSQLPANIRQVQVSVAQPQAPTPPQNLVEPILVPEPVKQPAPAPVPPEPQPQQNEPPSDDPEDIIPLQEEQESEPQQEELEESIPLQEEPEPEPEPVPEQSAQEEEEDQLIPLQEEPELQMDEDSVPVQEEPEPEPQQEEPESEADESPREEEDEEEEIKPRVRTPLVQSFAKRSNAQKGQRQLFSYFSKE